jgi:uncharacterized protein (TIGR03435 family)
VRFYHAVAIPVLSLIASAAPSAQYAAPLFDAASIRENTSGETESSLGDRPGGYATNNVPLRPVIVEAYRLRSFQVIGGPAWLDSTRFDINARMPAGARPEEVFPMLRSLLAERFVLEAHTESREQPIYALVVAQEGRLASQLRRSTATCSIETDNPCRMSGSFVGRGGKLKGVGQPIAQLARQLATGADRMVVDRTALQGLFDFDLTWTAGGFSVRSAAPGDDGPSLFTAIQEQLGLKLEPARGAVEMLVVDSAQLPRPD